MLPIYFAPPFSRYGRDETLHSLHIDIFGNLYGRFGAGCGERHSHQSSGRGYGRCEREDLCRSHGSHQGRRLLQAYRSIGSRFIDSHILHARLPNRGAHSRQASRAAHGEYAHEASGQRARRGRCVRHPQAHRRDGAHRRAHLFPQFCRPRRRKRRGDYLHSAGCHWSQRTLQPLFGEGRLV